MSETVFTYAARPVTEDVLAAVFRGSTEQW